MTKYQTVRPLFSYHYLSGGPEFLTAVLHRRLRNDFFQCQFTSSFGLLRPFFINLLYPSALWDFLFYNPFLLGLQFPSSFWNCISLFSWFLFFFWTTVFPHIIAAATILFWNFQTLKFSNTVFPHIVSSLKYFPPLNSFLTSVRKLFKFLLHKGKINEETI